MAIATARTISMRTWLWAGLGAALLGLPSMASAQEVYISAEQQKTMHDAVKDSAQPEIGGAVNLFSNALGYSYPKELVPVYQVKTPQMFMLEFIPYGENVKENWTEMLTIQGFRPGVTGSMSASEFAARFEKINGARCSGTAIFEDLGEVPVEGASSHRVIIGCKDMAPTGPAAEETAIIQVIIRNQGLVVLQYASRGKSLSEPRRFSRKYYLSLLDRLTITDSQVTKAE
jgi:hypothetical protein